MAGEIPRDLKQLTAHDITHIDALWQIADLIVGDKYPLTPTEAFVLGGAFLLHDLGLALASYPAGMAELEKDPVWEDAAFQLFRGKHGRSPGTKEMASLDPEIKRQACEQALRLRHAAHAEELATIGYRHTDRDQVYHLIEDEELRRAYGRLIGRIAHSHWWPSEKLPVEFDQVIGAFPGTPVEWTVDPLKLALVVRMADACHLDERRAPGFVRALRNPTGESEKHWRFQEYVQTPYEKNGRLVFSASKEIPIEDVDAWWLGYEMLSLADRELRDADAILRETARPPFAVDAVAGAIDPARLAHHFPTKGWAPIPTKLQISDVPSLVRNLGGQALYGENPRVPLRELIQNARDAVVARRIKEGRDKAWGQIAVRLLGSDTEQKIEVRDTGVGMSSELLVGPFLDFGTSYWNSALMLREHPGLASKGFEPQGRFGIGFFSIFMWGEHIKVITRRPEDSADSTRVLEFGKGLSGRPVLRRADVLERLIEPGTVVQVWLDRRAGDPGGILAPGPIESRFAFPAIVRREKAWSLRDVCAWLCPAIDVNLVIEENEKQETSASASDWETMTGTDLLRRLLLHCDDVDSVCGDDLFRRVAANVRDLRDENGRLLGRAALKHFMHSATGTKDILNQASAVTAGSFRAFEQIEMVGVLLGRPKRHNENACAADRFRLSGGTGHVGDRTGEPGPESHRGCRAADTLHHADPYDGGRHPRSAYRPQHGGIS